MCFVFMYVSARVCVRERDSLCIFCIFVFAREIECVSVFVCLLRECEREKVCVCVRVFVISHDAWGP